MTRMCACGIRRAGRWLLGHSKAIPTGSLRSRSRPTASGSSLALATRPCACGIRRAGRWLLGHSKAIPTGSVRLRSRPTASGSPPAKTIVYALGSWPSTPHTLLLDGSLSKAGSLVVPPSCLSGFPVHFAMDYGRPSTPSSSVGSRLRSFSTILSMAQNGSNVTGLNIDILFTVVSSFSSF
ncbi:hypothetical protein B0H14DRAFT_1181045 [Mycena olivaceomarginata]|nr:hypothetical protein B0H14DRAFT_1181045 [Mycena olivaceomarginata]